MSERDLILGIIENKTNLPLGTIAWEAPSNIAIIKYWGKKSGQIPINPSLSFSLKNCVSRTEVTFLDKEQSTSSPEIVFTFNKKRVPSFSKRIGNYFESIQNEIPWIADLKLVINSSNTFPDSAGIASSASAFASLALSLAHYEYCILGKESDIEMMQRASHLARLGSGSASRSVFGGFVSWGKNKRIISSNDHLATPIIKFHPDFKQLKDAVLLVSNKRKPVSSTQGHALMNSNPFQQARMEQVNTNYNQLIDVLETGDKKTFIDIAEHEALTLHALMMTSKPGYLLLKPESIQIIERIRLFRKSTGIPVGFTIDAGPNIHLLYFKENEKQVKSFINDELLQFCQVKQWIDDELGTGPFLLSQSLNYAS